MSVNFRDVNIGLHTGIERVEFEKEVVFIKDISVKEILKERKRRKIKRGGVMDWLKYAGVGFILICTLINLGLTILTIIETNDYLYEKKTRFLERLNRKKNKG